MRASSSILAALLFSEASGVRHTRSTGKTFAGVTVHNWASRQVDSKTQEIDWFVAFDSKTTDEQLHYFCKRYVGKTRCTGMGHPEEGGAAFVQIQGTDAAFQDALEVSVADVKAPRILFAEPRLPMYVPEEDIIESTPSANAAPWHLDRIGVADAKYTGKGVHIYVMDTGVRSTHQDFGGRALPTVDTIVGGGALVECHGDVTCATDYHGHGTHVAGTAGGTSFGAAPESNLYVMKVCCGAGTNVEGAMDWVTYYGERPIIMTVSLASAQVSYASKLVVDSAVAAGVTVFVGAANDNVDTCTMTYGFIPSAISVGATDSTDRRAYFSNWGRCNDIYAPGVAILSAWLNSDTETKSISGTSMATPLTAGVGALILEENPSFGPQEVLDLMLQRAIPDVITDLKREDPNLLLSIAPRALPTQPPAPSRSFD